MGQEQQQQHTRKPAPTPCLYLLTFSSNLESCAGMQNLCVLSPKKFTSTLPLTLVRFTLSGAVSGSMTCPGQYGNPPTLIQTRPPTLYIS